MTTGLFFAHAGGWDETLFVLTPIAIFASLLAVANKRAQGIASHGQSPPSEPPPADPDVPEAAIDEDAASDPPGVTSNGPESG